jgi:hypothetical protein
MAAANDLGKHKNSTIEYDRVWQSTDFWRDGVLTETTVVFLHRIQAAI